MPYEQRMGDLNMDYFAEPGDLNDTILQNCG